MKLEPVEVWLRAKELGHAQAAGSQGAALNAGVTGLPRAQRSS